jgi:predicted enzyme related to lactoylglutathione lyase
MALTISFITFDCVDNHKLAAFWAATLEAEIAKTGVEDIAAVGPLPNGQHLLFLNVPESKSAKNRLHLDLHTPDHEAEVTRVVALGATVQNVVHERSFVWTVLADPEGNEFCIVEDKKAA